MYKKDILVLEKIRFFFKEHGVSEVITKSLLNYPAIDNNIDSIIVDINAKFSAKTLYLHTSAELEMKKLLINGYEDIYQICTVYRDNEIGRINFNEFIMLEYYLLNIDEKKLIKNILELFVFIGIKEKVTYYSYKEIFKNTINIDITDVDEILFILKKHNLSTKFDNIADMQMLLFVHFIEKKLTAGICIIYDFPKEQSAFAKVVDGVAKRFEIYINGVEIANGYNELQQAKEYRQIFSQHKLNTNAMEKSFLQFIAQKPLPQCSGVAIGLNRLFNAV